MLATSAPCIMPLDKSREVWKAESETRMRESARVPCRAGLPHSDYLDKACHSAPREEELGGRSGSLAAVRSGSPQQELEGGLSRHEGGGRKGDYRSLDDETHIKRTAEISLKHIKTLLRHKWMQVKKDMESSMQALRAAVKRCKALLEHGSSVAAVCRLTLSSASD